MNEDLAQLAEAVRQERVRAERVKAQARKAGGMYDPILKRWIPWDENGPTEGQPGTA